jgi:phosphoribosylformylglycinamidine cyclo-ligase
MKKKISYKDAGVDIEKADNAIASSRDVIQSTFNKNVLSSIGGFGAMYSIKDIVNQYDDPVLVQSIDGVGTKMAVAQKCNNFDFIGYDLVNACCNDVAATGAKPLTFLDYIASSSLEPKTVSEIISSVAVECKNLGVSLVGGETAEMPGTYHPNEYDLVGIATGIIERKNIVDGSSVKEGDLIMGIPSNGLHTNGYSLARKLIFDVLHLGVDDMLSDQKNSCW